MTTFDDLLSQLNETDVVAYGQRDPIWTAGTLGEWTTRRFPQGEGGDPAFMEVVVPSARGGDPYSVMITQGSDALECSCPGFKYRENCRHVTEVRAVIEGDKE